MIKKAVPLCGMAFFLYLIWYFACFFVSLPPIINNFIMSNSRTITIKNPSRKLEEKIREAGVQKYLWLKELCSEETKPNKVIYV